MYKIIKQTTHKILDIVEIFLLSLLVFLVVYFFIGQLVQVSGNSMEPSFYDGQQLLAEKISINFLNIKKGDIVIFNSIEKTNDLNINLLIKRVIATQGDIVKIQNGLVYVNNNLLDEPYLKEGTLTNLNPDHIVKDSIEYKVGADSFFILGDNREVSRDSRYFGAINKNDLLGKIVLRYFPINEFKFINK